MKNESKLTQSDLEDISFLFEDLLERLPKLSLRDRVDVAARIRTAAKHADAIDKLVKADIKKQRNGKEGYVLGEKWKAKLSLVPVKRLDQKALKEGAPQVYEEYTRDDEDQRITFEAR